MSPGRRTRQLAVLLAMMVLAAVAAGPARAAYQATVDTNVSAFSLDCLKINDSYPSKLRTAALAGFRTSGSPRPATAGPSSRGARAGPDCRRLGLLGPQSRRPLLPPGWQAVRGLQGGRRALHGREDHLLHGDREGSCDAEVQPRDHVDLPSRRVRDHDAGCVRHPEGEGGSGRLGGAQLLLRIPGLRLGRDEFTFETRF